MNTQSHYVFFIRWCIYGLAGGFCIYEIFLGSWNGFGGPFRYLTIWALFLSFYSSNRMLALSRSRTIRSHQITAICASVLNVMVVYLYWKLYFTDPSLVNSDGPSVWYREYYLHGLGPALQIIDAVFIGRIHRRVWRAILPVLMIITAYVIWVELFVQKFNMEPVGSVTSGLPYPFLNSMELDERILFYAANAGMAIALIAVFGIVRIGFDRIFPA